MNATSTFCLLPVKLAVAGIAAVLLLPSEAAAAAALAESLSHAPGFWGGFGDGFLALLKLLVSPLYDFALVDYRADGRSYDIGYYLGVLLFAAFAGLAASPAQPIVSQADSQRHESQVNRPVVG